MSKNEKLDISCISNRSEENIQWRFAQMKCSFNDKSITCVEFNHNGELLAVGGRNGHVVIYKRTPLSKTMLSSSGSYTLYSHFKSHSLEFDCLKSLEIEEKINKIRWLQQKHCPYFLLSTNDKSIKLWKINEIDKAYESDDGALKDNHHTNTLRFPRIMDSPLVVKAMSSRIYENLHDYNINSISLNSDQETFLSADDLRIYIWHLDVTNRSFNVVDIKPNFMADLTEVITSAEFHPTECNIFAYSSSEGAIRLCDMRSSALCERYSKRIKDTDSNMIDIELNPLNYIKISPSGRYLMARDYMNINVYDLKMENKLLEQYSVHDFLRGKRLALYETQRIFDRFECCWSGNDDYIMTGTYNNFFKIFDRMSNKEVMLEAKRERIKPRAVLRPYQISSKLKLKSDEVHVDFINYDNKIQYTAWHPEEKTIAIAAKNDLFIYKENL